MKRLSDLIGTTLSTAGLNIDSLTNAFQALKGIRTGSRFLTLINARRIVDLQTRSADLSHTVLEGLDVAITNLDTTPDLRTRSRRGVNTYPYYVPEDYTYDIMGPSLYRICNAQGWIEDNDRHFQYSDLNSPVYVEGIDGASILVQLVQYDRNVCLQIGQDDGAYLLSLYDGTESTPTWPGVIYYTHPGEGGQINTEAEQMAVELGLLKQEDGSYANLQATIGVLSAREASYALLSDLCSAAYTNATIPITTVQQILDSYGSSEVSEYVKSMIAGYSEMDSTSVLSIVSSALDNLVGSADSSGTKFVPKDRPGFMTDLVGAVAKIIIAGLAIVISFFLKGVGALLLSVAFIISQILPKLTETINNTDIDVIKVTINSCWNLVGPAGLLTMYQLDEITDSLDEYIADNGMAFLPISSFNPVYGFNADVANDDFSRVVDPTGSVGVLIYPKTSDGNYPAQWVIPLLSLPSENIADSVRSVSTSADQFDTSFTIVNGKVQCSMFPHFNDDSGLNGGSHVLLDDLAWTQYSDQELVYSINYSLIMSGVAIANDTRWLSDAVGPLLYNQNLGDLADLQDMSTFWNTLSTNVSSWVRASSQYMTGPYQSRTGVTLMFLADFATILTLVIAPYVMHWIGGHTATTKWNQLSGMTKESAYNTLYNGYYPLNLASYFSYLARSKHYTLYSSGWLVTPKVDRVSASNSAMLIALWAQRILPGQPAYDSAVIWPSISRRAVIKGLIMTAATIAVIGATVFVAKRAMKRRAVPRLAMREKQFSEAQKYLQQHPADKKARKRLNKANKRLTKAWKKAGRAGVSMYNGFETGAADDSFANKADAISASIAPEYDTSVSMDGLVDDLHLLIAGSPSNPY